MGCSQSKVLIVKQPCLTSKPCVDYVHIFDQDSSFWEVHLYYSHINGIDVEPVHPIFIHLAFVHDLLVTHWFPNFGHLLYSVWRRLNTSTFSLTKHGTNLLWD